MAAAVLRGGTRSDDASAAAEGLPIPWTTYRDAATAVVAMDLSFFGHGAGRVQDRVGNRRERQKENKRNRYIV